MQVEHKTEKGTVLFILVAPDASNFRISKGFPDSPKGDLSYDTKENVWQTGDVIINEGYGIIGLTSDVTEEQCDVMLPGISTAQLDGVYYSIGDGERYCHENALSAFKSLMQHLQINESEKWLILFKPNES